jgi:DNA-binding transcriptional LysR family regulator
MLCMPKSGDTQIELPVGDAGGLAFTLKELRHVALLVESRNFIRAARRAGVSQSALSQSVAGLESRLGVLLFNRSRRQVLPTQIAELIAERAALVLNTLADMSAQVEALRDARDGAVVCGMGVTPANRLMAESMLRFDRRHPGVRVRVDVAYNFDLITKLLAGKIEFCVSIPDEDMDISELDVEPLYEERLGFLCRRGHPLTQYDSVSASLIVRYPIIANSEPHLRRRLLQHLQTAEDLANLERNAPSMTLQRLDLLAPFVAGTDYVLLGVLSTFRDWLADGRLCVLPVAYGLPRLRTCLVTRNGLELSPAAKRMTEIVREIANELHLSDIESTKIPAVSDDFVDEDTAIIATATRQSENS